MRKIILGILMVFISCLLYSQKNITRKQIIWTYSFDLQTGNYSRGKSYLIDIDGTLTGSTVEPSDPNKPYRLSDDNSTIDKGTWNII